MWTVHSWNETALIFKRKPDASDYAQWHDAIIGKTTPLATQAKRCPVEFSCKQIKVMFTFSVTHQNPFCVSLCSNKGVKCISFLLKHWKIFKYFKSSIVCIHVYLLAGFFFPAIAGTSLHILACYWYLFISGIVWIDLQDFVLCHLPPPIHVCPCACAQVKKKVGLTYRKTTNRY